MVMAGNAHTVNVQIYIWMPENLGSIHRDLLGDESGPQFASWFAPPLSISSAPHSCEFIQSDTVVKG